MKWFKHFSDNHRGRSIQGLLDDMGHAGPCCLFFLMELCAEKLEKIPDKNLESSDCLFEFHERVVRQNLRISQAKLKKLLNICQGFGLFTFDFSGNILKISMPMLLDLLEYDQKKTRHRRASVVNPARLEAEEDTDTDTEEYKKNSKKSATVVANPPQEPIEKKIIEKKSHWLVDMWNEFGAKLPKAHTPISSARLKKIQARIKERPDPELWKAAIIRLAESNFANGLNDRAWVAGFDFILQADSLDKILEGKYDNRRSTTQKERMAIEQQQRLLNGEL